MTSSTLRDVVVGIIGAQQDRYLAALEAGRHATPEALSSLYDEACIATARDRQAFMVQSDVYANDDIPRDDPLREEAKLYRWVASRAATRAAFAYETVSAGKSDRTMDPPTLEEARLLPVLDERIESLRERVKALGG